MNHLQRAAGCVLCLLLLCAALAACGAVPGTGEPGSAPAQSGVQALPALRPRPRSELYVPGNGVVYRTIACPGGGGLITCLDLATLEERVLCSAKGCAHTGEACPAWMPGSGMLFFTQDALYSYATLPAGGSQSSMPLASLRAHALDGSQAHEVAQVSDSWQLGVFAQGGDAVYGIMNQHLARLDLATGHETILERNFYLHHNFSLYGLGELNGNLVIPMTQDGQQVFYAMDAKGAFTELCRGSYGPGTFCDGKYYYSDAKTGSLYVLDLATGKASHFSDALCEWAVEHTWDDGSVFYTGSARRLSTAGGRLLVEVDARRAPEDFAPLANVPPRLFSMPLSGGPAQEVTLQQLYQGYGVPLAVLAETPAGFLVVGDTPYLGTHIITGQDGGTYPLEAYGEALALIAPEDYFASNPNFRFFEQLPNPYPG